MAIKQEDIEYIREQLSKSVNPLFLFDDDADGLCSFLLLYRYVREGHGVFIKTSPELSEMYLEKVNEYSPDLIVILDKPQVSQVFLDKLKIPVIWIDHHVPVKRHNVKYFNPRLNDDLDNRPTTYWCYKIVQQDLWIATTGCIADWHIPDFVTDFMKEYPDLLPKKYDDPAKVLFETRIGELYQLFNFILKGKTSEVKAAIKILTRINDPYEILDKTSSQGKYLYKKYSKSKKEYEQLLSEVMPTDDKVLVYEYSADRTSYTAELSNELLYKYPTKMLIICREKSGEMRCSLRSKNMDVASKLKGALIDVRGYGGGHLHACGACIKKPDFPKFVENMKELVKNSK
ncbi:MAG: DHH family phosphoesterase [Nanoarchaeota archaeon]|nr:DHH family phosphoesterase [Nanoarchaeota archaeon]